MAVMIPTLASCVGRMTGGERRLAERLQQKLEDDYTCWFNVPIGEKQFYPDFIILNPHRGVLVLEVKDWKLSTIQHINRLEARLLVNGDRLVRESNPLEQARMNALRVDALLRGDTTLRNPASHRYPGKLVMPYGWGAVLANITRKQFCEAQLDQVLEPGRVICSDEMTATVDASDFQERLWGMFAHAFAVKLSLPQVERVRWNLFPELRIATQQGTFGLFDGDGDSKLVAIPDLVKVMDAQQELLARSMGDGHRVIHGVAGSGKTMILGYRSLQLAKHLQKPILILCYNVTLAARLRLLLQDREADGKVSVRSFHEWCGDLHTTYQVPKPVYHADYHESTTKLVESTIQGIDRGQIPRAQYGAVLIDEGHDFQPEWFKLVVQMLDPESNSLLVLYDDAQSIYARTSKKKFSFASVGIQAVGRTTILKLNYRNTLEILSVAKAFAEELLTQTDADEDHVPVITPDSAGRRGPLPQLIRCKSANDEAATIAERIQDEIAQGRSASDIGVLVRYSQHADAITAQLSRKGIAFQRARKQEEKRALFEGPPSVKVVSLHSSKGLEFGATFIPRACELGKREEETADDARLLYVGMTRAVERLVVTHVNESVFCERVGKAIAQVAVAMGD